MRSFLHGIRQAFLRPVGACFGLLLSLEDEAAVQNMHALCKGRILLCEAKNFDNQQANGGLAEGENNSHETLADPALREGHSKADYDLHQQHEGNLLRHSGEEADGNLQPIFKLLDGEGDFLPHKGEEEEGDLLPQSGEDFGSLLPLSGDDGGSIEPSQNDDGGNLQPAHTDEDGDCKFFSTLGATYHGDFFLNFVDHFQFAVMHARKQVLFADMHAEIGGLRKASMVHDNFVIDHAKPRVNPKVKKKTSLLLCLTIHMSFHPGEHVHDGYLPSHHHETCSSFCLYIESQFTPSHPAPKASSTSTSSIHVRLFDIPLDVTTQAISMPFTPLRGRKCYQGREKQFEDQVQMKSHGARKTKTAAMKIKMKTKIFMMLIIHATLDPG